VKAKRLNHWTKGATNAARRIYAELMGAVNMAETQRISLAELTMGQNTKTEPDVYLDDTTASFEITV